MKHFNYILRFIAVYYQQNVCPKALERFLTSILVNNYCTGYLCFQIHATISMDITFCVYGTFNCF